ncbi:cation:proton antiporter [Companilactobacillus furfuricola]|uniref:cation:proton antiporter n=1 Tax=Companilactobacillus furfuricola TaxID=1462575 RepID=UPI000F793413|nr:sodium:proton antiporter [Companilactobacillus furfuricola]
MNTVFSILLIIAAVIVANAVFDKFQLVPVAFLQIAAGLILAIFPLYQHFELEPEIFMLVIISMLMFNDGQNTSLNRLTRNFSTTFSLAVELAIVSILVIGAITHFFLPKFSIALCFALGAIIVPTDAVAVSSITSKVLVPKDVMSTLENESLFNDASGIVALNLATAAVITGQFSVWAGVVDFLYVFFGGIIVGTILGTLIISLRVRFINHHMDAPSVMVPYTLMTPFVVYLIAEAVDVSGILAVVMTGLLHGVQQERLRLTSSRLQIVMNTTWSVFASILNGIVFVLLGLSLPRVIHDLSHRGTSSIFTLVVIGIVLYLAMTIIRFLWIQSGFARIESTNDHDRKMNSLVAALSGVHGTITLSLAFSLPLTLSSRPFTYRTDIIFIATVVILTSLIIPTLILPQMLPKKIDHYSQTELAKAKSEMVTDSINNLTAKHPDSPAVGQVISILDGQRVVQTQVDHGQLNEIFNRCFDIEADFIQELVDENQIDQRTADFYMRITQKTIFLNQQHVRKRIWWFIKFQLISHFSLSKRARENRLEQKAQIAKLSSEEIMTQRSQFWLKFSTFEQQLHLKITQFLNQASNGPNAAEVSVVSRAYDERHRRLTGNNKYVEEQNELLIQAFQQEYNFIQLQSNKKIYSNALSNALYEQISTDQLV